MLVGILLGNFVPNTGPALQKGRFVGISVPMGMSSVEHSSERVTDRRPAVGLFVMMSTILYEIRFETLRHLFKARTL